MSNKRGKVLYDFQSQADNQINLKAGQILTIVSLGAKGGWSKAIDATGKRLVAAYLRRERH